MTSVHSDYIRMARRHMAKKERSAATNALHQKSRSTT
jgi:hypothetical protein